MTNPSRLSAFPFPSLIVLVLSLFSGLAPAQVSLRSKLGQMIMVTATGDSLEQHSASMDTLKSDLDQGLLGGLIMFTWSGNLKSPGQITHFTSELQKRARTPLLLAIDEEGGQVARLSRSNGFTSTPSAAAMGYVKSEPYTRSTAATMAGWFTQTGLTMNLAPVVDVNVNPASPAIGALQRSFSARPDSVALQAGWFIDEFHKRRVITTLKHYPGHGSATSDSHLGFTDITRTWSAAELQPYSLLLGQNVVDAVMTAHVFNGGVDSVYPATLSQNTITGILRAQLGYSGVVVSDEMGMAAITSQFGLDEAAALAVNAGVDVLLYSKNLDSAGHSLARHLVDFLEGCVNRGAIPLARVEESYQRVTILKAKYLTTVPPVADRPAPAEYAVENYPNPFNGSTLVVYDLPAMPAGRQAGQGGVSGVRIQGSVAGTQLSTGSRVRLGVYDILGREVALLVDERKAVGRYEVRWDATGCPSGVYLCRMMIGGGDVPVSVRVRRMLLLR